MRYVVALTALVLSLPAWAGAQNSEWWFKTPGGAAYCGFTGAGGWRCMRPADGFWIELTQPLASNPSKVHVRQGHTASYRGFSKPSVQTLTVGRTFESSDAAVITCWSRRNGVTCKHYSGLSFRLGRTGGYRIYYELPGFRPLVRPLFRTANGVWCGILRDTFVPEDPTLLCWRPSDGLLLSVDHADDRRGSNSREEQLLRYRPDRYPLLGSAHTFTWRCRDVVTTMAERCSPTTGIPVFTCTSRTRLTCTNRRGRGFWVNSEAFAVF